jgi:hypothetical protein
MHKNVPDDITDRPASIGGALYTAFIPVGRRTQAYIMAVFGSKDFELLLMVLQNGTVRNK